MLKKKRVRERRKKRRKPVPSFPPEGTRVKRQNNKLSGIKPSIPQLKDSISPCPTTKMVFSLTLLIISQLSILLSAHVINPNPGYRYSYSVKDTNTGDYKTQEETRNGDSVRGSYTVGEPNGDLRVVTYQADKNSGFNAQVKVQPGGVQMFNYNRPRVSEMMRNVPRYQKRTGFPQLEIKVVPPLSLRETTPKPEEILETTTPFMEETTVKEEETEPDEKNKYEEHICSTICNHKQDEGRARIKQNEDKVQVEMEQIIRTEMQEPSSINMGMPYLFDYKNHKTTEKPVEEITQKTEPLPSYYQSKVFLLPFNINSNDYLMLRSPYHDPGKVAFPNFPPNLEPLKNYPGKIVQPNHPLQQPKIAHIFPMYTTGLAFLVIPRAN